MMGLFHNVGSVRSRSTRGSCTKTLTERLVLDRVPSTLKSMPQGHCPSGQAGWLLGRSGRHAPCCRVGCLPGRGGRCTCPTVVCQARLVGCLPSLSGSAGQLSAWPPESPAFSVVLDPSTKLEGLKSDRRHGLVLGGHCRVDLALGDIFVENPVFFFLRSVESSVLPCCPRCPRATFLPARGERSRRHSTTTSKGPGPSPFAGTYSTPKLVKYHLIARFSVPPCTGSMYRYTDRPVPGSTDPIPSEDKLR
ncbi:hypothetical protein GW17_00028557 [Ensete ventricosum]|nr:hypothetical protein GW17_00028557 [Ensete ventricosum]RZR92030.1 hypothetical protein BHM03_00020253 [Ensete ventricosum]